MLREQLVPGATVVIDPPENDEGDVRLRVVKPKKQKTPVGVGAEGGPEELPEADDQPAPEQPELPELPEPGEQ